MVFSLDRWFLFVRRAPMVASGAAACTTDADFPSIKSHSAAALHALKAQPASVILPMSYPSPVLQGRGLAVVVLGHMAILGSLLLLRPQVPATEEAAPLMATLLLSEPTQPESPPEPPPPQPVLPKPQPKMTVQPPPPPPEVPVVLARQEAVQAPSPAVPPPPVVAIPEPPAKVEPPHPAPDVPKAPPVTQPPVLAVPAVTRVPLASPPAAPVVQRPAQPSPAQTADEMRRYLAQLMGQLNRHKRYPAALKKAKIEGRVVLEFTLDKFGRLKDSRVKQGSGHPELDQAALSMLARATPLPAIPAAMNKEELSMSVPVEYSLITDR